MHTININRSQVTLKNDYFLGEASTMNLPPGIWPDFIVLVGDVYPELTFTRGFRQADGGYAYESKNGIQLLVLND